MEITEEFLESSLDMLFPNFEYRPYQKEMILATLHSIFIDKKRYTVLSAGTGSGKSHIAHKVGSVYHYIQREVFGKPLEESETLILTKTISLQNQYTKDFFDIKKLMNGNNYDCSVEYTLPINPRDKFHSKCRYDKKNGGCEYAKARVEYASSPLKLLNNTFYMSGIDSYNTRGLLICDEAHNFEESLLSFLELKLDLEVISRLGREYDVPSELEKAIGKPLSEVEKLTHPLISIIINFIHLTCSQIAERLARFESMLESDLSQSQAIKIIESKITPLQKDLDYLKDIGFRLSILSDSVLSHYSISFVDNEKGENGEKIPPYFDIKPVFIPKILESEVLAIPHHIVFMSATSERVVESLKLNRDEVNEFSPPYIFPLENRPFYAITNLEKLNHASFDTVFPKYVEVVDEIISQYSSDTNVIIHSVSYKNANLFMSLSKHSKRIFIPTSEEVRELKSYISRGTIIISPSITEGVDLGSGLASVQIFIKCPYPYLGDKWVNLKMELDKGWYDYVTMLHIIQGSGRGIRSKDDRSDTFIIDPSFKRLYNRNDKFIPDWFKETIQWIEL